MQPSKSPDLASSIVIVILDQFTDGWIPFAILRDHNEAQKLHNQTVTDENIRCEPALYYGIEPATQTQKEESKSVASPTTPPEVSEFIVVFAGHDVYGVTSEDIVARELAIQTDGKPLGTVTTYETAIEVIQNRPMSDDQVIRSDVTAVARRKPTPSGVWMKPT